MHFQMNEGLKRNAGDPARSLVTAEALSVAGSGEMRLLQCNGQKAQTVIKFTSRSLPPSFQEDGRLIRHHYVLSVQPRGKMLENN